MPLMYIHRRIAVETVDRENDTTLCLIVYEGDGL